MKENNFWNFVRKNIIGRNVKIITPFGERFVTYADYTASGRNVTFMEELYTRAVWKYPY